VAATSIDLWPSTADHGPTDVDAETANVARPRSTRTAPPLRFDATRPRGQAGSRVHRQLPHHPRTRSP